ncbi:hypothetical protein [Halobacillus campisalis]|uniref:Uncharacterized protein n=1 Tax=Halobacillus campisalis TaxID=435909 RepID=A0ABW2K3A9_9BACI|nr:hypothetical protein [Halobacillus campisalis]
MVVVILNCFHWSGYHCARHLLHRGHEVVGVDEINHPKKEELYMYVGRNSHFQHFNTIEERENHSHSSREDPQIFVSDENFILFQEKASVHEIKIEVPPLYGEWMEMEDKQIETIDDLKFWIMENNAVYIEDFLDPVMEHFEQGDLTDIKDVTFQRSQEADQLSELLERIWLIHTMNR